MRCCNCLCHPTVGLIHTFHYWALAREQQHLQLTGANLIAPTQSTILAFAHLFWQMQSWPVLHTAHWSSGHFHLLKHQKNSIIRRADWKGERENDWARHRQRVVGPFKIEHWFESGSARVWSGWTCHRYCGQPVAVPSISRLYTIWEW